MKNRFLSTTIIFISYFFVFCTIWLKRTFCDVTIEEIIFNFKAPMSGTNMTPVYSFIISVLLVSIFLTILSYFLVVKNFLKLTNKKKIIYIVVLFLLSIIIFFIGTHIGNYYFYKIKKSNFIEKEYINPKKTKITFKEKRNLIYIVLESMESSYTSKENGGLIEENLISELSTLAEENINFSNTNLLGGALSVPGTTWTSSALAAQTSGMPLNPKIISKSYNDKNPYLKSAYTIGDILKENGYNEEFMMGSNAEFGARKSYFINHGNYKIWDVNTAIKNKKMNESDKVWWGFEDKYLFEWAKEEILILSKKEEPFNFTMLTVNTHYEDGYLSDSCEEKYDDQYSNVISCSSKQVYEFINWIKKQEFYPNTTIVITGDHLTMDSDFYDNFELDDYERTIYNVFINSVVKTDNIKNRKFTTMDMFPTTLAAMGAKIEGDRLGIGTNLFSNKKTVAEKYGIDYVRKELSKTSKFYNNKFIYNKETKK